MIWKWGACYAEIEDFLGYIASVSIVSFHIKIITSLISLTGHWRNFRNGDYRQLGLHGRLQVFARFCIKRSLTLAALLI